jgi:hypothetical protein
LRHVDHSELNRVRHVDHGKLNRKLNLARQYLGRVEDTERCNANEGRLPKIL